MARELFGTDGVRGLAGEYPLNHDGAVAIGRAVGTHFAEPGQAIVIAGDPRRSSPELVAALTEGLIAVGVNVVNIGVLPTPGLAYIAREKAEFVAGVMVTASHNPVEYNGVKVFDQSGGKLNDEIEATLNTLIVDGVTDRGPAGEASSDESLIKTYEDFLVSSAGGTQFTGLKVAIDSANGAASGLAQRVFECLGAAVAPLFDKPDGQNINAGCGATDPTALSQAVKDNSLDLGIALDGDADRIILVDAKGRVLNGDHIMYICAVSAGLKGVVATVMSNLGLEKALTAQGVDFTRVQVGDRYVLAGLQETGYGLGGEQSGHIIFPELLKTGDALLAAVQTIKAIQASGKSLSDWYDELQILPQALVNIPLNDKAKLESEAAQQFLKAETDKLGTAGRLLIRPSGTEPLVRIMVEAPDAQPKAEAIANQLMEILND